MKKKHNKISVMLTLADRNCSASEPCCTQRDPEQQPLRMTNKIVIPEGLCRESQPLSRCVGFTLVELLVVVLIIGILTAIAVPMYQSAVDKTHWSTLLPTARALKNAEEAYLMATNVYTDNADALDVAATEGDATYQLQMPDSAARYVIRGSTTKLPNVRLAQYLDENASYANLLFCEAATDDERAVHLCNKLLKGNKAYTTDDNYTAYLMDSSCRQGTNYLEDGRCGYENIDKQTIGDGEVCTASNVWASKNNCIGSVIEAGGKCIATSAGQGCTKSTIKAGGICEGEACGAAVIEAGGLCLRGCASSQVEGVVDCRGTAHMSQCGARSKYDNGGICVGSMAANGANNCIGSSFTNGSICYANSPRNCGAYLTTETSYDETSCCCGAFCPATAPSCASRGKTCEAQYMK